MVKQISGLHHIVLTVSDLERSSAFYERILGITRQQLEDLLLLLKEMDVPTAGIEFDPDGQEEYVCFRDPDNIQVEFYIGDYHD